MSETMSEGVKAVDYDYDWLLQRFYNNMGGQSLIGGSKIAIPAIALSKLGGKRVCWTNFGKTCQKLKRDIEHVKMFFVNELRIECSINGEQQLVIQRKFTAGDLSKVISNYINIYVICKSCKSGNTQLNKEKGLLRLACNECHSTVTITRQN